MIYLQIDVERCLGSDNPPVRRGNYANVAGEHSDRSRTPMVITVNNPFSGRSNDLSLT